MNILPLRTKSDYLCIDTELFNALNQAHLNYVWDYTNKGLRFDDSEEYEKAMELKRWSEDKCRESLTEVVSNKPTVISNVPKISKNTVNSKRGRLF